MKVSICKGLLFLRLPWWGWLLAGASFQPGYAVVVDFQYGDGRTYCQGLSETFNVQQCTNSIDGRPFSPFWSVANESQDVIKRADCIKAIRPQGIWRIASDGSVLGAPQDGCYLWSSALCGNDHDTQRALAIVSKSIFVLGVLPPPCHCFRQWQLDGVNNRLDVSRRRQRSIDNLGSVESCAAIEEVSADAYCDGISFNELADSVAVAASAVRSNVNTPVGADRNDGGSAARRDRKQPQYMRENYGDSLRAYTTPNGVVSDVSQADIDVSFDEKRWFHAFGPKCFSGATPYPKKSIYFFGLPHCAFAAIRDRFRGSKVFQIFFCK